jgi:hypothetical protein
MVLVLLLAQAVAKGGCCRSMPGASGVQADRKIENDRLLGVLQAPCCRRAVLI